MGWGADLCSWEVKDEEEGGVGTQRAVRALRSSCSRGGKAPLEQEARAGGPGQGTRRGRQLEGGVFGASAS